MIFKKSKEDHTLLNPLHSSLLSSKSNKNDQPNQLATIIFEDQALDESDKMNVNQPYLATIMINHKNSSTSGSTKRLAVDTPAVIEEGREEETEERDDNNREFSRQTSYNINTERDNVEIQPTINGNGLDHLSYTKTLWHESPDSIEIPNIKRSTSQIVPASSLANYSLEARSKLQRIQSVNVEKVELGLLNEQIGCLAVDNDGNDYGDVTMLPSLKNKSSATTAATELKKKKATHTATASSNGTSLKHMFIKKKRYTTKKDTQKKKVSNSSKTSAASSRSIPSISESPLGFEVGDDGLSNIKPVDKQKKSSTKKTKVSVDIRESPLGFELVGDGSNEKDTKKTAINTSPSSKGTKKKNTFVGKKKKTMRASRSSTKATKTKQVSPLVVAEDFFIAEPVDEPLKSPKVLRESPLGFEVEDSNHCTKKDHEKKKGGQSTTVVTPLITKKEEPTHDIQTNIAKSSNKRLLAKLRESPLGFEVEEGSTYSIDMSEKEKEQVTPPLSSSSLTPPSAITDRKVSFVDNLASKAITDIMTSETLAERSKYQSFGLWGGEKEKKSQTLLLDEGMIVPQEILDSLVEETDEEDSYVSSTKGVEDLSEEETLIDESMLSGESTLLPKEESIVDDSTRGGYKLQFDLPKMEKKTSRLRLNHIVRLQSLNRMRTRSLRRIATEQGLLRFKASESLVSEESSVEVTLDTEDEIEHVDIVKDKRKNNNKKNSKRSKKGKKKSSRRKRKSKSRLNNQDDTSIDLLNEVERFLDQSGNVLANWGDKLLGFSSEEETLGEETLGSYESLI